MDQSQGPMPLAEAIRLLLEIILEPSGIDGHLDYRLREEPASEPRNVVHGIVREALTNVQSHSNASSAVISVEPAGGGILVTIEDDGSGFEPMMASEPPDEHIGLLVMDERAQRSGGWLRAESAIGRGATIKFWIPTSA